ncbi:condensation domain-containing protein [Dactylosporangium sp. NPDC051485]|uniref:condensation domain-containing protein n=1 Tax=Dactylosporangium sp. NPDC051485 TaxID=3154846 RepID=UPI0034441E3C
MSLIDRVTVPFKGDGEGTEELTWGQFAAWRSMQVVEATEWAGGTMALAEGTTVRYIATMLGFIMGRHQSLRTRLVPDGDGPPRQCLAPAGEVTLEVYAAGDSPEEIRERYEKAPWDPWADWPVRMAVVADGERALHLVALYCHMVIDGYGFEALVADLANLDPDTGAALAPVEGIQPLDLTRAQRGRPARRAHEASLRYWERHLRAIAPRRFPRRLEPAGERWHEATLTTPATDLALAAVAGRTKVHSGTVLLAAYASMLASLSGQPVGAFRIVVSNRFRPGFAASVSNLAQAGLAVIDTSPASLNDSPASLNEAAAPFDEVVARAWSAQLAAGMHAYYHPKDLWALVERVGQERGEELDTLCYFNDRRRSAARGGADGPPPSPREISAALPASRLRWGPRSDEFNATSFLHVDAAEEGLELTWRVDTTAVSPPMLEAGLRQIESLIVAAAQAGDLAGHPA